MKIFSIFLQKVGYSAATLCAGFVLLAPAIVGAEDVFKPCNDPAARGSVACKEVTSSTGQNPLYGPNGVLTSAIKILSIVVAIAAVITIIVAGLKFVTSGSNPQDVSKSRELIIYAIVGLIVAALAQAIVRFFLNNIGA